jgi:hypothetical protein
VAWGLGSLVVLLLPVATGASLVDDAGHAMEAKDHARAITLLRRAEVDDSLDREDRTRLLWMLGSAYHLTGRTSESARAFDTLLHLEPLFTPDARATPAPLKAAFQSRVFLYQQSRGVFLDTPKLKGREVVVPVTDPTGRVHGVTAQARPAGGGTLTAWPLTLSGGVARGPLGDAGLWDAAGQVGAWEVVIEARDREGVLLARQGTPGAPLRLAVAPPPEPALPARDAPPAREAAVARPSEAKPPGAESLDEIPRVPAAMSQSKAKPFPLAGVAWGGALLLAAASAATPVFGAVALAGAVATVVAPTQVAVPVPGVTNTQKAGLFLALGVVQCVASVLAIVVGGLALGGAAALVVAGVGAR